MDERNELIFFAEVAKHAERYDDMVEAMRKVILMDNKITTIERRLFFEAYKKSVGERLTARRILWSIEEKEINRDNRKEKINLCVDFKRKIELEISEICNDALHLIDDHLLPNCTDYEHLYFFFKIKADFYHYLYEICPSHPNIIEQWRAFDMAQTIPIPATTPIKLGFALAMTIRAYEILNDPRRAYSIAEQAFNEAVDQLYTVEEEDVSEIAPYLQNLRDNMALHGYSNGQFTSNGQGED